MRHASKGVRRRARKRRSTQVATRDCRNRKGASSKLVCVRESVQDRVVSRWSEKLDCTRKNRIHPAGSVSDVKIQRKQNATEMQFWIIVQGTAEVTFETLGERPCDDIAQRIEVEMEI